MGGGGGGAGVKTCANANGQGVNSPPGGPISTALARLERPSYCMRRLHAG